MHMFKAIEFIKDKLATTIDSIKKTNLGLYVYYGLTWYVKTSEKIKQKGKIVYNSHPFVRTLVDNSLYGARYLLAVANNQKIEPMNSNWICNTFLMVRDPNRFVGDPYYFLDMYEFLHHCTFEMQKGVKTNDSFADTYSGACLSMESIISSTNIIKEGMVTMKNGNQYKNRVYFKNKKLTTDNLLEVSNEPLKYSFLTIKYTHPIMKDEIFIDLDKGYYYADNEILSPLFIKRHLEHQSANYYFDMEYDIEIIDNNIESLHLKSNQYILLNETTYTVMNISD